MFRELHMFKELYMFKEVYMSKELNMYIYICYASRLVRVHVYTYVCMNVCMYQVVHACTYICRHISCVW